MFTRRMLAAALGLAALTLTAPSLLAHSMNSSTSAAQFERSNVNPEPSTGETQLGPWIDPQG